MGSVGSEGEDESHPNTKCKSWEKILQDCGAGNNSLIPRKPRSGIEKRARENIVLPWSISRKKHRVEKFRSIMKKGEISKDEEEVVETLNSLAQMFSNTNKPEIDDELSIIKSSNQGSAILNVGEESEEMNTSNHSSAIVENVESSSERSVIARDQAENAYDKFKYTKDDKCKGILTSPTLFSTLAFPTSSENASSVVQHRYIADKYPRIVGEPKKTWKRCSTHVRIAHLIKAVQKPKTLAPRPTQLTISRGVDQMRRINVAQTPLMLPPRRDGSSLEAFKQFNASYQHLPTQPNMAASSTFHGRTTVQAALQARLSGSILQQRWPAPTHGGFATPHLRDWQTGGRLDSTSFLSQAQPRFPYLHIGPKFQLPPPQPRYMPFANSFPSLSNMETRYHHMNLAYDRNGGLYSNKYAATPLRWMNHRYMG